jgi:hypothetical protein
MKRCPTTMLLATLIAAPALAQEGGDATALAKAAQNPVAAMISVPFQYNINLETGPLEKTQHILNIQPVYPIRMNAEWNVITRTIVPVISQPAFNASQDRENGLGDIQFSAFLSPQAPSGGWIWGAGMIVQLDTATDDRLGQGVWGLGPTAVALKTDGPWLYGALINNVWSVSEDSGRASVNQLLLQPFINYNFPEHPGRYLSFSPIITADWKADSGQRWVVPLGLSIGQIVKVGTQPLNLQAGAYYNVERPDAAARWQIRLLVSLMFPK